MKKTNPANLKLSTKANSINHALDPIMTKLYDCKDVKVLYDIVKKATENISGEKTIAKRDELLSSIKKARNCEQALSHVFNFYLKGDGLGTLKI